MSFFSWRRADQVFETGALLVVGGRDADNELLFVGRVNHAGDLTPGKVNFHHGPAIYVPHVQKEHKYINFEVLTTQGGAELFWVPESKGKVPFGAIEGGKTSSGETLYIARFRLPNSMVVGKLFPAMGRAFVSFAGREHSSTRYEVLCHRPHDAQRKLGTGAIITADWARRSGCEKLDNQSSIYWEQVDPEFGVTSLHHVVGGIDLNDEPLFVARAHLEGDLIPGKLNKEFIQIKSMDHCYVPYGGDEHISSKFEVLTVASGVNLVWKKSSDGRVPPEAIEGGITKDGEKLYIGRFWHENSLVVGKVHPSHRVAYVGFDCNEHNSREYEVLCRGSD